MATGAAEPTETIETLARLSVLVQRTLDRCATEYGLSSVQARLLQALTPGAPTINELARQLTLDKSSVSGLVDRAQQRGLVRRLPSQLDRRSVRVRLTDEGRELAREISMQFAGELAALLAPLSAKELDALTTSVRRLLHG